MSTWVTLENFQYSRTATRCRWALAFLIVAGVAGDYYQTHYYRAFDPQRDGRRYVVDWSGIGRPRCQMLLIPDAYYTNYSPWTPQNGDVVVAREVVGAPNFLQLLNGRFVERQTCGVQLMIPYEEYQEREARNDADRGTVRKYLTNL